MGAKASELAEQAEVEERARSSLGADAFEQAAEAGARLRPAELVALVDELVEALAGER